jgi:acetyl esterase/lipase
VGLPPPGPAAPRHVYGPAPQQFGELSLPDGKGPFPVAVAVHGGFWSSGFDLTHLRSFCAALADAGWAVWSVEYRRVGERTEKARSSQEGGGWPNTMLDVAAAADHLRTLAPEQRLDLDRVVSVGHSAGGHLALWLAARRRLAPASPLHRPDPLPLRGAVSLAGVCDLRRAHQLGLGGPAVSQLMGGSPDEVPDRYAAASPAELLPLGTPQVLVHGSDDVVVPVEISRAYQKAAAAKGDDAQLVEIAGVEHFGVINPRSPAWPKVKGALAKFL